MPPHLPVNAAPAAADAPAAEPTAKPPVGRRRPGVYATEAFCPRLVLGHATGRQLRRECEAVVALLDLAGFSALCSQAREESATEELSSFINDCFRDEMALIEEFGGDVVGFAGDGLLVVWPVDAHEEREEAAPGAAAPEASAGPLAMRLRAAAAAECCLRVQEHFAGLPSMHRGIRLRAAVAASTLSLFVAGTRDASLRNADGTPIPGRMVFFVAGAAVTEAGDALGGIGPGQVALCPSLLEHLDLPPVHPPHSPASDGALSPSTSIASKLSRLLLPLRRGSNATDGEAEGGGGQTTRRARRQSTLASVQDEPETAREAPRSARRPSLFRRRSAGDPGEGEGQPPPPTHREPGHEAEGAETGRSARSVARRAATAPAAPAPTEPPSPAPAPAPAPPHDAEAAPPKTARRRVSMDPSNDLPPAPAPPSAASPKAGLSRRASSAASWALSSAAGAAAVDSSLLPHLASHSRAAFGAGPSGSLAGRLRADPPALQTRAQRAAAELYVPFAVRARLRQLASLGPGADPSALLSEFRTVSVLFLKLDQSALAEECAEEGQAGKLDPAAVRRAVRSIQTALYERQGSLRQVVVDDKGMVAICVFGLYPLAHPDDPLRCVACALDIRRQMAAAGVEVHAGCTTGVAYSTFVGTSTRCEFSCFGNVVNKAARQMGKAGVAGRGILADSETTAALEGRVEVEPAGEFALKGFKEKEALFRPVRVREEAPRPSRVFLPGGLELPENRPLFGRDAELEAITAAVEGLAHAGGGGGGGAAPGVLLLVGDSGSGKSALARQALQQARRLGCRAAVTRALPCQAHAFALWRFLLAGLYPGGEPPEGAGEVELEAMEALHELMPSPNAVHRPGGLTPAYGGQGSGRSFQPPPWGVRPSVTNSLGLARPSVTGSLGLGSPAGSEHGGTAWSGGRPSDLPAIVRPPLAGLAGMAAAEVLAFSAQSRSGSPAPRSGSPAPRARLSALSPDSRSGSPTGGLGRPVPLDGSPARRPALPPRSGSLPVARPRHAAVERVLSYTFEPAKAPEGGADAVSALPAPAVPPLKGGPRLPRRRRQTVRVPPDARASALRDALARAVLARASSGPPLLLVLEDLHDADGQSIRALVELARRSSAAPEARLLLLVTCRPLDGRDAVLGDLRGRTLELAPLRTRDVAALARAHLRCGPLPAAAAAFIASESGGVPFIAADVAERLVQEGFLAVDAETRACTIAKTLRNPKPSDGLRTAIMSRVDKLSPSQLLTIKLASVLGNRFAAEDVLGLHPAQSGGSQQVEGDLEALCAGGLLREAVLEAAFSATYEFVLTACREVVYLLLPATERRRLHRRFAGILEMRERMRIAAEVEAAAGEAAADPGGSLQGSLIGAAPLSDASGSSAASVDAAVLDAIGRHYLAGDDLPAATPYLEHSAAAALHAFANTEAQRLYEELLGRCPAADALHRANWIAGLAKVFGRTGRFEQSLQRSREALRLLGHATPTSALAIKLKTVVMATQLRMTRPPRAHAMPAGKLDRRSPVDVEIARLHSVLREAAVQTQDRPLFLFASLCGFSFAMRHDVGGGSLAIAASEAVHGPLCIDTPLPALKGSQAQALAALYPASRAAALAYARFAWELESDFCHGDQAVDCLANVASAQLLLGESEAAGGCADEAIDVAVSAGISRHTVVACALRFAVLQRGAGTPAVLERLAGRTDAALERIAREQDPAGDAHAALGGTVLAAVLLHSDRAAEALVWLDHAHLQGGPRAGRAGLEAFHAQAIARVVGLRLPSPGSGRTAVQAAGEAVRAAVADRNPLGLANVGDALLEAGTVLLLAWLQSGAPAARGHPAAALLPHLARSGGPSPSEARPAAPASSGALSSLAPDAASVGVGAHLGRASPAGRPPNASSTPDSGSSACTGGGGGGKPPEGGPAPGPSAPELRALLDAAAGRARSLRSCLAAKGAAAAIEGLALSARGEVARARRKFLAAAAEGARRPRDAGFGLLLAAAHAAPPHARSPYAVPDPAGPIALLAAAERFFRANADAFLARAACGLRTELEAGL